jgi:hypothetical protein
MLFNLLMQLVVRARHQPGLKLSRHVFGLWVLTLLVLLRKDLHGHDDLLRALRHHAVFYEELQFHEIFGF